MKNVTPYSQATPESSWAEFQESRRYLMELHAETERYLQEKFAEADRRREENERYLKEMSAETDRQLKETDRILTEKFAETDRQLKETARSIKETDRQLKETKKVVKELSKNIGGVANSNGEMAEDYFYSAFKANKTFANEKFDKVERNRAYKKNEDVEAEFDLVLFNGKSAAIIEVKYKAKSDNISVRRLIARVEVFKRLYPEYKDHKIYLGVAAMSFNAKLEARLHQAGIATIRQVGKKMVRFDKDVKAF